MAANNTIEYIIKAEGKQAQQAAELVRKSFENIGAAKIKDPTDQIGKSLAAKFDQLTGKWRLLGRFFSQKLSVGVEIKADDTQARAALANFIRQARASSGIQVARPAVGAGNQSAGLAATATAATAAGAALTNYAGRANAANAAQRNATQGTNAFAASLGGLQKALVSVSGFVALEKGLKSLFDSATGVQQAFQRLKFSNGGDLKKTAEDFAFVGEQANRLGLPLKAAEEGYSKLAVGLKEAGYNTEQVREVFLGVSAATSVMGMSAADSKETFRALGQIANKSKVSMEELNQQLGERLPGVMSVAAKAMGIPTEKLVELVEQGKLTGKEFLAPFGSQMRKTFEKDALEAANSLQANTNRMANAWEGLKRKVNEGGFEEAMKNSAKSLTDFFKSDDALKFADSMGKALSWLADMFVWLVRGAVGGWEMVSDSARITAAKLEDEFGQPLRRVAVMFNEVFAKIKLAMAMALRSVANGLREVGADTLANSVQSVANTVAASAYASTEAAKEANAAYNKAANSGKTAEQTVREQIAAEKELRKQRTATNKAGTQPIQNYKGPGADELLGRIKGKKGGSGKSEADKLDNALRAYQQAVLEAEKKLADTARDVAVERLEGQYKQNLIDTRTYLTERSKLEASALDEELKAYATRKAEAEAALAKATAANDQAAVYKAQGDLKKVGAEIDALNGKKVIIGLKLDTENFELRQEIERTADELRAAILEKSGDQFAAAALRIQRKLTEDLKKKGIADDAANQALVKQLAHMEELANAYDKARKSADDYYGDLEHSIKAVEQQAATGALTQQQAEQRINAIREQSIAKLEAMRDAAKAAAEATANPDTIRAVRELTDRIEEVKAKTVEWKVALRDGVISELKTGIESLFTSAKKLSDMLRELAISFLGKLASRQFDKVAANLFDGLDKAADAKKGGGMDGYFSSLGESLGKSVVEGIQGSAGVLKSLFSKLFSADTWSSLFSGLSSIFKGIGGAFSGFSLSGLLGFATGGSVRGPGTGTSDSILAKLSNGEFVLRAEAVRKLGVGRLQFMNAFGRMPAFATGGLYGDAPLGGGAATTVQNAINVRSNVVVSSDSVISGLRQNPAFERYMVEVMVGNRKKLR